MDRLQGRLSLQLLLRRKVDGVRMPLCADPLPTKARNFSTSIQFMLFQTGPDVVFKQATKGVPTDHLYTQWCLSFQKALCQPCH